MALVVITLSICVFILLLDHFLPIPAKRTAAGGSTTIVDPSTFHYDAHGIDPNAASVEELCSLPGVGEKTANAFIEEREENGPFIFPEDMLAVRGIGEKKLENIRPLITLQTTRDPGADCT